jgi:ABC-type multidrug transport system fused ATPase/permease subunit
MKKMTNSKKKGSVSLKYVYKTFIRPKRKLIFFGLVLISISRLAALAIPLSSKMLFDEILPNKDYDLLKSLIPILIGAVVIQAIISFILTKLLSVKAHELIRDLRVKVQEKIILLPISFFDNEKSGALVSRIMSDVEGVRNLVGTGLVQLIGGILTSFASLGIMIYISPKLTLLILIPVILSGLITIKGFGIIRPIFRERGKINAEVKGRLTESLNGVRVIKGFNAEEQEVNMFKKGANKLFDNVTKSLTATSLITSLGLLLMGVATIELFGFGGALLVEGAITQGDLFLFTVSIGLLVAPIVQMSNIGSQLTEAFAGLDRTKEILDMEPESNESVRTISLKKMKGDVVFKNVSFEYENNKEVLHHMDLHAESGSVTALVGSSGSGKSTIASLVASFIEPKTGEILIDGEDLSKINLNDFRSQLGVVLQDDFLFEGTIRENILFPRPESTDEELKNAVEAAYVNEFTDRFEDGLDTTIGERGVKLSGGQKQRISIARAILANPRILILDEATSNLDTESESFIQKSLDVLLKGRTTFVIAHRLSTIKQADQILVVEDGSIAERGTHDELITKEGRYYQLYTYQAKI